MAKTCSHEGCNYSQFGGGYCRNHQWCRTDKKPKSLQRTPIRKVGKYGKKRLGERKLASAKDKEFFAEIWDERPHICFESGEYLGNEPFTLYFHHVLEKEMYEQYRYEKWNIVLLTWVNHDQCHKNLDKCPKVKEYRNQLIKKYES